MAKVASKIAKDKKSAVNVFTEVERAFLELQITDCNRKIARLRKTVDEYEVRNEELQKAYETLDVDRADIIAYLKKQLQHKNDENNEFKDKIKGLEEAREIETARFKETVAELERTFTFMKDQLTSENKLLAGKLNTLEEFRAIRDDLMQKFEKQEQDFKDQEMKYKRILYDAEKKFVIGKDKLKKEMEARLLKLAQDFQDATELRIAASTHRVIRENIAINNELDTILSTQAKLADQNEKFKEHEKCARIAKELAEEERDKAINKNVVQLKVIDQLTSAFQKINKEKCLYERKNYDFEVQQAKIQKLTKENENLFLQVRVLEQNLHARMSEQNRASALSAKIAKESAKMKKILKESAIAIKAGLKLDEWAVSDPTREVQDRKELLSSLLEIITQYREVQRADSVDTLASFGKIYEDGDLGFVPKRKSYKKTADLTAPITSKGSVTMDKSQSALSTLESSTCSFRTIPSIHVVKFTSDQNICPKESLPSFVTSSQSSVSEEAVVEEEHLTDIQKKLAQSQLDIQRSIMKDLAYSMNIIKSQSKLPLSTETAEEDLKDESKVGELAKSSSAVAFDTEAQGEVDTKDEGQIDTKDEGETKEGEVPGELTPTGTEVPQEGVAEQNEENKD